MSRRVYLLGVGIALVALALVVTDWAVSDRITEENWEKIRERTFSGITGSEVQALLGRPPDVKYWDINSEVPDGPILVWIGRRGSITVYLTGGNPPWVWHASFCGASEERLLDRLRTWLGW